MLGEERLLTGPEAGITRDSIAVTLEWQGRAFRLFDTAGMRRKARIEEKLEKLSVADALNAIRFAEVVVVLMDAERPFEEQDLRIADLVQREGRALVLGMNKWDLVEGKPGAAGKLRAEADHWLPQVKGVPIVAVSGPARRRARPADAGGRRRPRGLEPARVDQRAQPLVRGCGVVASAARGERPAPQAQLHHAGRKRARRASCCSARAPTRCRRAICAIWSTACATRFDLPGTPIRLTLREKANPYAGGRRSSGDARRQRAGRLAMDYAPSPGLYSKPGLDSLSREQCYGAG